MKLSEAQLANQVGEPQFRPHLKPTEASKTELLEVPLPGGGYTIELETSGHDRHAVVIDTDIGHRSFLLDCDGTIISAQG